MSHLRLVPSNVVPFPAQSRVREEAEALVAECNRRASEALVLFRQYMDLATELRREHGIPEDVA